MAGRDAQAVAALLGLGAVGVEDPDGEPGRVEGEQAVRAHAPVAVAEAGQQGHHPLQVGRCDRGPHQGGVGRSGEDRVDPDAVSRVVERHRPGQRFDARLGGCIRAPAQSGALGPAGGNVDDPAPTALEHSRQGQTAGEKDPIQINVDVSSPRIKVCDHVLHSIVSISSASATSEAIELPGSRWSVCGRAACMPRVRGS